MCYPISLFAFYPSAQLHNQCFASFFFAPVKLLTAILSNISCYNLLLLVLLKIKMDLSFRHPFTLTVSGPTGSGKTQFTKQFVENSKSLISPEPVQIIWCYSEYQDTYKELQNLPDFLLVQGLPDLDSLRKEKDISKLIILDDLMSSKEQDKVTELFVKGSHHWNCSVVYLVQNLFFKGSRTSRINSHYLVLLKNPTDKLQIATLSRQLFPENPKFFTSAFKDATEKPFSYLLVDLHQSTPEQYRLRSNIFPNQFQIVYVAK